jgi:hypothetical protein
VENTAALDLVTKDLAEPVMFVSQRDATAVRYRKTYYAAIERRRRRVDSRMLQQTAQRRWRSGLDHSNAPTNAVAPLTAANTPARNHATHRTLARLIARALPMLSRTAPVAKHLLARSPTAPGKPVRIVFQTAADLVSSPLVAVTNANSYATRETVFLA